jgi:hypothetical protein
MPVPLDLAEHRPILPYEDAGGFTAQLDEVHRAAVALIDPLRDVALAVQGLSYKQKAELAAGLRTSVMRLTAWASLVLEAR